MKIFIIYINYYTTDSILKSLSSLKKVTTRFQVVVVDNGSKPGETDSLKQHFPHIKIIENKRNLGFAVGANIGIKFALHHGATHVILLNPDTKAENDFILPLIENGAHIVAPVIKFERGGRDVFDLGGYVNFWLGRVQHYEVTDKKEIRTFLPDYVSGACMMIRKEVFNKIGFFDQRFFLYFEDTDFCLRAKRKGLTISVEPKSVVLHKLVEGKRKPVRQNLHLLRSNLYFINKHIPTWNKPISWAYWILLSVKVLLNYLSK